MENEYNIDYFITKKNIINQKEYETILDIKTIKKIKCQIIKELEIKDNKVIKFIWRRENILSNSLKKINKDLLHINLEINKLTENNFLIIYNRIYETLLKKTEISNNTKINYIVDSLLEKSLIQINFNSLYICFLKKLMKEQTIKNILKQYLNKIITKLQHILINILNIDDSEFKDYKFLLFLKENKKSNKQYTYLGNIYSLFYLYDIIDNNNISNIFNKYINIINDLVEWTPVDENLLEKTINIFIGLLEYGYLKLKKQMRNDDKIKLNIKIENILKKKISLRIKFNLKNMYEDLNSNSKLIKTYIY